MKRVGVNIPNAEQQGPAQEQKNVGEIKSRRQMSAQIDIALGNVFQVVQNVLLARPLVALEQETEATTLQVVQQRRLHVAIFEFKFDLSKNT